MATVRQALERLRENGSLPMGDTPVSIRNLPPVQVLGLTFPLPGSMRQIILSIFARMSRRVSFAVILCRYKDDDPDPALEGAIKEFFEAAFTSGSGGLVEYWRDVTFGALDISASQVIDWVELDITRAEGGLGSGVSRVQTVQKAMEAAQRKGIDTFLSFNHVIAVVPYNWTVPGFSAPVPDWSKPDPNVSMWIDGSADGKTGVITLTPSFTGAVTAHEMGHTLGMSHDFSDDAQTAYADPCCVMSQSHDFVPPGFGVAFGPAICATHLILRGWLYKHRIYRDNGDWMNRLEGTTVPLAQITDVAAHANLAIVLPYTGPKGSWDYYLEYARPQGWNQGLSQPFVFVRRAAVVVDNQDTSLIMAKMPVPTVRGQAFNFVEPRGNVEFRVHLPKGDGRFLNITARTL
jgi:hypothetical protein